MFTSDCPSKSQFTLLHCSLTGPQFPHVESEAVLADGNQCSGLIHDVLTQTFFYRTARNHDIFVSILLANPSAEARKSGPTQESNHAII